MRRESALLAAALSFLLALASCSNEAAVVGTETSGSPAPAGGQLTTISRFDPATIPVAGEAVPGTCAASSAVVGAYRCTAENALFDPCFALADGRLICSPNPVSQTYAALIDPGGALPAAAAPDADANPFLIELEGDVRVCALRTAAEPVSVGGVVALYDCDAPYTYVVGFEKAQPYWEAAVFVLDPNTGAWSGKLPRTVLRAWTP
jgi:hypothetical protein